MDYEDIEMTDDEVAEELASEFIGHAEDAVMDMAYGQYGNVGGVKAECEADRMYNDPDILTDMLGDWVHDHCRDRNGIISEPMQERVLKILAVGRGSYHTAAKRILKRMRGK